VQGRAPVTGRKVQAHQTLVGILLQGIEDEPALDRGNGGGQLSCLEVQVGEAVEDLAGAQVPAVALEAHPVIERRSIAQRKALQKRPTGKAGRALEPGEQASMGVFWHGKRRASRRARRCPGVVKEMQVELECGGEIQGKGVAGDEEVRHRILALVLAEQVTQMQQGNAQGRPAMPGVSIRPEQFGEVLARVDVVFDREVEKECEFLACGELHHLIGVAHVRRSQECQEEVVHLTVLLTLCWYHEDQSWSREENSDSLYKEHKEQTQVREFHVKDRTYPLSYRTKHGMRERIAPMPRNTHALPEDLQAKVIEILNRRFADAIDLQLQSRQAYWNVKGTTFLSLRELFDKVAREVERYADRIAERIVQLGGTAEGTAKAVAERSALNGDGLAASADYSEALATVLSDFGRHTRYASAQAIELMDADTAALFTQIARGIDKWLWFVETGQPAGT
jgi:starvation-inducible DNA-binding protein